MSEVSERQKLFMASLNAAVSWFLVWWTASVVAVAAVASFLPMETLQDELIMSLSELTPAINIWAGALKETPVMRVVWIYMTITSPFAIFYMLYRSQLKLFLLIDVSLWRLVLPAVFNAFIYVYMIVPMTVFGKFFGREIFSATAHDSLPTFGTRVLLGSPLGGLFGSWLAGLSFCALTLLIIFCSIRFLTPVINGVTHGIRK
jgi:hypothetical protein